jgi:hypothetical protein
MKMLIPLAFAALLVCGNSVQADDPELAVALQSQPQAIASVALQSPPEAPKDHMATPNVTTNNSLDAEEDALLEFVEKHQPTLLKLLRFMKKKQPQQFEQALKEVSKTKQRLSILEKRDHELFDIELALWKTRSELRMLVAQLAVSQGEPQGDLKEQLHKLVEWELDLESSKLQAELKRAEQRTDQLKSQIAERKLDIVGTRAKAIKAWEQKAAKQNNRSQKTKE